MDDPILSAAESLFNEQRYFPVSLELVAERAAISKRTLYKYFGDKNRLVCKVLEKRDAFFKQSLTDVIAVFSGKKIKLMPLFPGILDGLMIRIIVVVCSFGLRLNMVIKAKKYALLLESINDGFKMRSISV